MNQPDAGLQPRGGQALMQHGEAVGLRGEREDPHAGGRGVGGEEADVRADVQHPATVAAAGAFPAAAAAAIFVASTIVPASNFPASAGTVDAAEDGKGGPCGRGEVVQGSDALFLLGIGLLPWVLLNLLIIQCHLILLLVGAISATVPEDIIVQAAKAAHIIPVDTCHSKTRSLSGQEGPV